MHIWDEWDDRIRIVTAEKMLYPKYNRHSHRVRIAILLIFGLRMRRLVWEQRDRCVCTRVYN
jgi:hypothetical protein